MKRFILIMLTVGCGANVSAQSVAVRGQFLTDSVSVGQPVKYALTVRYPSAFLLLMPDSTFKFEPFEWSGRTYFPTHTENGVSLDSLVYQLTSFEIDSIQTLAVPVFVVNKQDCTAVWPENDTLFFSKRVFQLPDSLSANALPLRTNTDYWKVPWQLNSILIALALIVTVVVLTIVWLIFGKRIRRYWRLRKLNRQHLAFVRQFNQQLDQLQAGYTVGGAEGLLVSWKQYMEQLSEIPYTKYTTQEVKKINLNTTVLANLTKIDLAIYGGIRPDSIQVFQDLKAEAEKTYHAKISAPKKIQKTTREYSTDEVMKFVHALQTLPCPVCGQKDNQLNGTKLYRVWSIILFTSTSKKLAVACPACLRKKNRRAALFSGLLGWWGIPWGLLRTPQYIYLNLNSKRQTQLSQPNQHLIQFAQIYAPYIEKKMNDEIQLMEFLKSVNS